MDGRGLEENAAGAEARGKEARVDDNGDYAYP